MEKKREEEEGSRPPSSSSAAAVPPRSLEAFRTPHQPLRRPLWHLCPSPPTVSPPQSCCPLLLTPAAPAAARRQRRQPCEEARTRGEPRVRQRHEGADVAVERGLHGRESGRVRAVRAATAVTLQSIVLYLIGLGKLSSA